MLCNCKIKQDTIKKILECYVEDYTSTETSKALIVNRKTVNRYYDIFRKICLILLFKKLTKETKRKTYIGYVTGEYGPKNCFDVYKINEKTFIPVRLLEKPKHNRYATYDDDLNLFLQFIYNRLSKFRGFADKGYYYQLFESILRYNYTKNELYKLILTESQKANKDKSTNLSLNILNTMNINTSIN